MRKLFELEDIAALRFNAGIDDVQLREAVARLKIGDLVRLTVLADTKALGAVLVRITSIAATAYRGKVAGLPAAAGLVGLRVGSRLLFTSASIHSVAATGSARDRAKHQTRQGRVSRAQPLSGGLSARGL